MRYPIIRVSLLLTLAACARVTSSEEDLRQKAAFVASSYELYFSNPLGSVVNRLQTSTSANKPPPETIAQWRDLADYHVANGGDFISALTTMMEIAQGDTCELLVAGYEFDVDAVAQAMADAKHRGCDVRFVTDGHTVADPKSANALRIVTDAGIEMHHDGSRGAIMHNKFVIAVGAGEQVLWTGSWNFTHADQNDFWNHGVLLHAPSAVPIYREYFENLFARFDADGNRTPKVPLSFPVGRTFSAGGAVFEVYFPSIDGAAARIAEALLGAKRSIDVMAFAFTSTLLVNAVAERARAGVEVRGVFENTGACSGAYRTLYDLGEDNVHLSRWKPGTRSFLHHKVFIIDDETVVFGSYNFSEGGEKVNDENVLIVSDKEFAKAFVESFELLETAATAAPQVEGCSN